MNVDALAVAFEHAGFLERRELAAATARQASPEALRTIAGLLRHEALPVRLGAIETLAEARFRPAMRLLAALAKGRTGDEQVFALAALSRLAEPADAQELRPLAEPLARGADPFLQPHAAALLAALGITSPAPPAPVATPAPAPVAAAPVDPGFFLDSPNRELRRAAITQALAAPDPGPALAAALLAARADGVRLDLLAALDRLPPADLVAACLPLVAQAAPDTLALVARALTARLDQVATAQRAATVRATASARARVPDGSLAAAALDDLALAHAPPEALAPLLARVDALDPDTARRLARRLAPLSPAQLADLATPLLAALQRAPTTLPALAPLLAPAAPHLPAAARDTLLDLLLTADLAAADPDEHLALARLFVALASPGVDAPAALLAALAQAAAPDARLALVAVAAASATEAAAEALLAALTDLLAEVRDAARAALATLPALHVSVHFDGDGRATLSPAYRGPDGAPLEATHGALRGPDGDYALDARGRVVRVASTAYGACACCRRPRVLSRPAGARRPRCPRTALPHLRDGQANVPEHAHPLGGCDACDAPVALARRGFAVACPACHTPHREVDGGWVKAPPPRISGRVSPPREPAAPEPPPPCDDRGIPIFEERTVAPSPADLAQLPPAIASAMAANVVLEARRGDQRWSGSGVVVAREGGALAVLTNRHVVEGPNGERDALLDAITVTGEQVPARVEWVAEGDVDLALVSLGVASADALAVQPLGSRRAHVGARIFTLGNPMGLAWSYSAGTIAGLRDLRSPSGVPVRVIQTQADIAGGSSGGGVYLEDGELVGVVSFSKVNYDRLDTLHFAISMDTIVDTLRRERVTFEGRPLLP